MKKRLRQFLLPLLFTVLAAAPAAAGGRRFALLPLSDLSIDYNGIDLETTEELTRIMENLGYEAVPKAEIYDFMARQQIYDAGFLNAFNARKLGYRLNCELILTGTVTETARNDRAPGRFGLLVNGFSGRTGKILFTLDQTSALAEEVTFLALGEPRSQAELKKLVMTRMARKLARTTAGLPTGRQRAAAETCPCEVTRIDLEPDFARSRAPITVTVRLNCLDRLPEKVTVRDEKGLRLTLEATSRPGEYSGQLTAAETEGRHPLALEIDYGKNPGHPTCDLEEMAVYRVSNQPPPVTVNLKQGVRLADGSTIFSRQLLLVSHYPGDLPIDRWQVEVVKPDGTSQFQENYDGELPHRIYWRGWNHQRKPLAEGAYIFILRVWDRAGNTTEIRKKIAILRTCTAVVARTEVNQQGRVRLRLEAAEKDPRNLLAGWQLSLYRPDNREILSRSGTRLPADIDLPTDLKGDYIGCELEARDLIGNRFVLKEKRIYLPGRDPGHTRDQRLRQWNEDF